MLATGEPVADLEVSSHAGGDPGEKRFWSCTQFPVNGPDRKAVGVSVVMREITERPRSLRHPADLQGLQREYAGARSCDVVYRFTGRQDLHVHPAPGSQVRQTVTP